MPVTTPREFALEHLDVVRHGWDGVRDAQRDSIHDVRVALRRIRAALPATGDRLADENELCRQLGRTLGRIRELDVTQELFGSIGARLPAAACAVAAIRREVAATRDRRARQFVKALDELDLRPLARLSRRHRLAALSFWRDGQAPLATALLRAAGKLHRALDRAPAVYMPNRLHRVRIAVKKLRYTLEVARAAALPLDGQLMRDLRKTQDLLGRLHDCHVATKALQRADLPDKTLNAERRLLEAVVSADCVAMHAEYLARRDRLREICDHIARLASARLAGRTGRLALRALPVAGLVALPIAVSRMVAADPEVSG